MISPSDESAFSYSTSPSVNKFIILFQGVDRSRSEREIDVHNKRRRLRETLRVVLRCAAFGGFDQTHYAQTQTGRNRVELNVFHFEEPLRQDQLYTLVTNAH